MKMPEIISGNKGEINESKLHDYTRSSVGIRFIISEYIYGKTFPWSELASGKSEGKTKKFFYWIYERNGYVNLNVKADPEWRDFWRSAYESVQAGYHQNKEHWNTIILNGTVPDKDIKKNDIRKLWSRNIQPDKEDLWGSEANSERMRCNLWSGCRNGRESENVESGRECLHKNPDPEHIPCYRVVNSEENCQGLLPRR